MIPKPKYIENILEITKSGKGFICCDVVCECGARHFIGYKKCYRAFHRRSGIRSGIQRLQRKIQSYSIW